MDKEFGIFSTFSRMYFNYNFFIHRLFLLWLTKRPTRIELVSLPWQGNIIPLYHGRKIRDTGYDPVTSAWKADVLPINTNPAKNKHHASSCCKSKLSALPIELQRRSATLGIRLAESLWLCRVPSGENKSR